MKLFTTLNLSPELQKAIAQVGYTEMTQIQAQAIPVILEGRDVIGRSSTGTGKTAAFGIPAIESISEENEYRPQVLVLCPTRELAIQVWEEMKKFAKFKRSAHFALVYGGQSMDIQIKQLKRANIVIGTPGRMLDHIRRKTLKLAQLKMVVLDEADEMLNMGFYEDITTILEQTPKERQTLLFSATMPPEIMKITKEFQKNPLLIAVDKGQKTIDTITQYYYEVPQGRKTETIAALLSLYQPAKSIIFCNTKKMVDQLTEQLLELGIDAIGLHGDMRQQARNQTMQQFKLGRTNILVATDVAARGIDVDNIEAVFNFDIPAEYEYYIHRIGRTGRAGKSGYSFTLANTRRQIHQIQDIVRYIKAPIKRMPLPSGTEITRQKREQFFAKLNRILKEDNLTEESYLYEQIKATGITEERLPLALLHLLAEEDQMFATLLHSPNSEKMIETPDNPKVHLQVNIGRRDKIVAKFIVSAIAEGAGIPGKQIGKIDIYPDYTNIELLYTDAKLVLDKMEHATIKDKPVTFTLLSDACEGELENKITPSKTSRNNNKFKNNRNNNSHPRERKPERKRPLITPEPITTLHKNKQAATKPYGSKYDAKKNNSVPIHNRKNKGKRSPHSPALKSQ
ncbi:MAG: DEAD/DEAH box helicase [Peptococcaceae bacterium]|nr:DEAD/DEAH box helicase [Peptococcaceae bacterium]